MLYNSMVKEGNYMIIGIGTDIIEISRVAEAAQRKHFLQRLFTERERDYLEGKAAESMAGYFCAKEAVAKALGTGFSGIALTDIEIVKNNSVPGVVLHGMAKVVADSKKISNIQLSISHCREYATAVAIVEG